MVTFSCPWCDHEVPTPDPLATEAEVRCDDCATMVDLAPLPTVEPWTSLPLAA